MKTKDLLFDRHFYMATPDALASGAAAAAPATEAAVVPPPVVAPDAAAAAAAAVAAPALTAADLEAASERGAKAALASIRAADEAARRETEARTLEDNRRRANQISPAEEAISAMDMRNDMVDEIAELYKEMPQSIKAQVRNELKAFNTTDQLRAAKNSGLHTKLADAAIGEAIRKGTYVPQGFVTDAIHRAPVASEAVATATPAGFAADAREYAAALGQTLTDAEIAQAYKEDCAR